MTAIQPPSPKSPTFYGSGSASPPKLADEHEVISSLESVKVDNKTAKAKLKRKWSYETRRHFQPTWATLHPWAEAAIVNSNGNITQVRCIICSLVEKKEFLYVPKIDGP